MIGRKKRTSIRLSIALCLLLTIINPMYSQGMYGILGLRSFSLKSELTVEYLEAAADWYYGPDVVTNIDQDVHSSVSFGLGYMHIFSNSTLLLSGNPFINGYAYIDFNGFGYQGYDNFLGTRYDENGSMNYMTWNFGISYGLRYFDKVNINTSLEYTFGSIDNWDFHLEPANYLSINFSIGLSKKTKLGHVGVSTSVYPSRYYAGNDGPKSTCTELRGEIPIIIYGGLVFIGIAVLDPALGAELLSDLSGSSGTSSKSQHCHVFGKIRFVDFGEDYNIRFVGTSADLDVKYVDYFADSPGEWEIVEFGEDFKIRVVEFGEDFTIRRVQFGAKCNQ